MADKTRADLAAENAELRARIDELEAATPSGRPAPLLPTYGMSEGTRLDILEAQTSIQQNAKLKAVEITEPFAGRVIRVTADGAVMLDPEGDSDELDVRDYETPPPAAEV